MEKYLFISEEGYVGTSSDEDACEDFKGMFGFMVINREESLVFNPETREWDEILGVSTKRVQ